MKKGWQTKKVSEIAKHSLGKMLDKAKNKGEPQPYLRNLNVRWFDFDLSDVLEMPFLPTEVEKYTAVKGDVLICEGGYPGRAAIWEKDEPIYFQKALHRVRFHEPERNRWFLYYLLSKDLDGTLKNHFNGAGIQHFTGEALAQFEVPLPPLAEQQRIVGLLDEAFEGLATAKANAEKNLQNARALFESHLQSVFTQRGPGWVDRTLDQVCIVERGSSPRPIKEYFTTEPDGVNWIKIGDTEEGGKYVHSTAQKITPKGAEQSRFVKEGDFILTNSMSYGRPYIMKTSGYIHDGWFVLRLNMAIDTDYFYYLLSSPVVQLQFAALASGSVVKNISGDLVKKAVLPIPPLEQQHVIVEKLLALEEETQRLARLYERKHAALEALKKSLLHQAFTGAL